MNLSRRRFLRLNTHTHALAPSPGPAFFAPAAVAIPAGDDPDLHLLNRITWGARPEELQQVREMGRDAYLEEQLDPEQIDDSEADRLMQRFAMWDLDRSALYGLNNYYGRVEDGLVESMILRAVHSRRQLLERMVDFWSDHFNIPLGDEPGDLLSYQRDAIRKHALGNFQHLLMATAKSPAMLVYLDGAANVAEHPNENYARELFELHTLGVDGGYSEEDIRQAARAFTGWTTHPRTRSGFIFNAEEHDTDPKHVLGHDMPAGRGIEDGLHVLTLAARHPSTARFLSRKLCVRFVGDDPPASLVESTAQVWEANAGEIKPVLRHILTADEFYAAAGQKLRRPLEFFIGVLRATGVENTDFWAMYEMLAELGQTPYGWTPPDGYPDVAPDWISTNGLLARWNAAMALTHGVHSEEDVWGWLSHLEQRVPPPGQAGGPSTAGELVDRVATQVFGAPLPAGEERDQFIVYVEAGGENAPVDMRLFARKMPSLFGLMLASPLYQWR
jgi:uncharacterized protein (DUF1800 family)